MNYYAVGVCSYAVEHCVAMSHLVYPNLARLGSQFSQDLNYTGITLEGLSDPVILIPVVLLPFCFLVNGLPTGFHSWWALINFAVIHPMDFFVGTCGRGPKYLVDEYAVMDTRYWPEDNPAVTWISIVEIVIMTPLCYLWYRSIVKDTWYRPFCALVTSTFQMMGCILYLGAEWHVGFIHLPTSDWKWPPTFDSYWKIKYFWLIFIGCNFIWIAVPLYIYLCTLQQMKKQLSKCKVN